jgi:hypothetical protein
MSFTLADINDLKQGYRNPIHVGNIPYAVSKHLELNNSNVYLSLDSYKHIQKKHFDVSDYDLLMMPMAIQYGLLVSDYKKPNIIMCSYFDPNIGKRYIISVKIAANKTEIWALSMYRSRQRQTRALLKKGEILKAHSKR